MAGIVILYTYQTLAEVTPDLPAIKALGVDVVMNYYYTDNDATPASALALLDAYQAAGLRGLIRLGPSYTQKVMNGAAYTALTTFVNALKAHPALYGWYAYDEPTTTWPAGQLETVYSTIKAADPAHPVVIVYPGYGANFWPAGSGQTAYAYSEATHDVFGIDTYPISTSGTYAAMAGGYPGTLAGFTQGIADSLTRVTARDRTIFVLQTYVGAVGSSYPTAQQITDMAAAAAGAGWTAKGIAGWMWYWRGTSTTCLKNNAAARTAFATVAASYKDTTAPTITGFSVPASPHQSTSVAVTITATDDTAGPLQYAVTVDTTAAPTDWRASGVFTIEVGEGSHVLRAYAKDEAGNVSAAFPAEIVIVGLPAGVAPFLMRGTSPVKLMRGNVEVLIRRGAGNG